MHVRPDPARRRRAARAVPRAPVTGEHLLPVLLAPAHAVRRRHRPVHHRRLRRSDGVRRAARRRPGRRRPLRPVIGPGATPRSRSSSTTSTTAGASPPCSSSTSRSAARRPGIAGFTASVLPQNRQDARRVHPGRLRGAAAGSRTGSWRSQLAIEPTPEALAAIEERAKVAEAAVGRAAAAPAVDRRDRRVPAARARSATSVFRHLLEPRLRRARVPGEPAGRARGERAAPGPPSLDVPGEIDLAVIAVPAERGAPDRRAVRGQARARSGRHLVGLRRGRRRRCAGRSASWSSFARGHGMRLIGPNCLGVINTDPGGVDARDLRRHRRAARAARHLGAVGHDRRGDRRLRRAGSGSASRRSSPSATRPT